MTAHDIRRVSVAAHCDPRSVRAYLAGRLTSTRGLVVAKRVERAMRTLGLVAVVAAPSRAA